MKLILFFIFMPLYLFGTEQSPQLNKPLSLLQLSLKLVMIKIAESGIRTKEKCEEYVNKNNIPDRLKDKVLDQFKKMMRITNRATIEVKKKNIWPQSSFDLIKKEPIYKKLLDEENIPFYMDLKALDKADINTSPFINKQKMLELEFSFFSLTTLKGITRVPNFSSIQELSLTYNRLTSLPPGIFDTLIQLKNLGLGYNQLTTLPPGIFDALTQLNYLSLSNNKLVSLDPEIFNSITKLKRLFLNENQLTSLPPRIFDSLSQLDCLCLNENQLTSLPPRIFDNLSQLDCLFLESNKLSVVPDNLFNSLVQLEEIFIHDNNLTSFDKSRIYYEIKKVAPKCKITLGWNI